VQFSLAKLNKIKKFLFKFRNDEITTRGLWKKVFNNARDKILPFSAKLNSTAMTFPSQQQQQQ
jgi:hypothetical protein